MPELTTKMSWVTEMLEPLYSHLIAIPSPFLTSEKNEALNMELSKARENTKINRREPDILLPNTPKCSAYTAKSVADNNGELSIANSLQRNKKRGFRALLRRLSSSNDVVDTELSEDMQHLLSLGLTPASTAPPKERYQTRVAKEQKMRLLHKMNPDMAVKYYISGQAADHYEALRLDRPDPEVQAMSIQEWNGQRITVFQAELDLERHEQELDEKYCLRMKSQPEQEKWPVIKLNKGCLKNGEGKKSVKKGVRFDDVHAGKKVKWADVEHVGELEQPDVYFVDYGLHKG
ncbi:hypothetical protein E8E13_004065 [Curvularia kusanoi]|uniref:Uncharacterized protein n=1 Tax=Curvularia kusanoi TaxID=90978 RepID=A0A9P4TA76_CURKU|nr:hypothetical protein E8E13_004065 [Curvularia kusanoi]